jgi:hypothetical protein
MPSWCEATSQKLRAASRSTSFHSTCIRLTIPCLIPPDVQSAHRTICAGWLTTSVAGSRTCPVRPVATRKSARSRRRLRSFGSHPLTYSHKAANVARCQCRACAQSQQVRRQGVGSSRRLHAIGPSASGEGARSGSPRRATNEHSYACSHECSLNHFISNT